jgi:hypothetical protein
MAYLERSKSVSVQPMTYHTLMANVGESANWKVGVVEAVVVVVAVGGSEAAHQIVVVLEDTVVLLLVRGPDINSRAVGQVRALAVVAVVVVLDSCGGGSSGCIVRQLWRWLVAVVVLLDSCGGGW